MISIIIQRQLSPREVANSYCHMSWTMVTVTCHGYCNVSWLLSRVMVTVTCHGYRHVSWLPSRVMVTVTCQCQVRVTDEPVEELTSCHVT